MILLDTDHLTILKYVDKPRYAALRGRIDSSPDQQFGTTIVTVEEQWRGWFAIIARRREVRAQVQAYRELMDLLDFLLRWTVVPFDERAAEEFERLRGLRVRIGSMDLKIAAIALVDDATLLSANLRDFTQVPGPKVENWLD